MTMLHRSFTKHDFFVWQAPSFNFELSADQLLARALEVGFIRQVGYDQDDVNLRKAVYEVNEDYWYSHLEGSLSRRWA